jgi:deazaflavin-dependent oxidoreductase (nitroreductase family)
MSDWNQAIIDEFRANDGRVGDRFAGRTLLLLHHRGAKSGTERVNPLAYQPLENGAVAVFASAGGAPKTPDWFHNLVANPDATVEIGTDSFPVRARVAQDEERAGIWERQKHDWPGFAEYEEKTAGVREIPVIVLDRVSGAEPELLSRFFAIGMLLNVIAAMGVGEGEEPWAARLLGGCITL